MEKIKLRIKQILCIICGSLLCVHIFIPLLIAILSNFSVKVPNQWFMIADFALITFAFAICGFVTGFIVSYVSKTAEISTAILTAIVACLIYMSYSFFYAKSLLANLPKEIWDNYWGLDLFFQIIALLVFAILGAWLIRFIRYLKKRKDFNQ